MADEEVKLVAKLSLDTTDAERSLNELGKDVEGKTVKVDLPADTKLEMPKDAMKSLNGVFSGPQGIGNMGKMIKGVSAGLNGAMNSIQGITKAFSSPKVAGIITLIIALISLLIKLMAGTDTWKAMADAFKKLLDVLGSGIATNIAMIGDMLISLLDGLAAVLKPLIKVASDIFELTMTPVLTLIKYVGRLLKIVGAILEPIAEIIGFLIDLSNVLQILFMDLLDWIADLLKPLLDILKLVGTAVKMAIDWFKQLISTLTFGIVHFDVNTSTTGQKEQKGVKSSLDTWETSSSDKLEEASEDLSDSVKTWDDLGAAFASAFGDLGKRFEDAWNGFVEGWTNLWSKVGDIAKKCWDGISEWAKNVWNGIKYAAVSVWNWISTTATNVWNSIKGVATTVWNGIRDFAVNVWNGIKSVATTCWDWIKTAATNTWNWIADVAKNAWDSIVNWWKALWNGIQDFGSNVVSGGSGEGFGGGLFNDSGRWGDGYQAGDVIGSVGDFLAGVVGKGWLWADGGTLGIGAQMWGMNEQGNPEFLFNAGGHDTVINKEILSDAMYNALVRANGSKNLHLEVSVKPGTPAGPKEIVQMLLPSLKFALK